MKKRNTKFIGRERELRFLEERYDSDSFEFIVIYGRRRIGKTALINQFIQDKKSIFFVGVESQESQNLANFSRAVYAKDNVLGRNPIFPSFQAGLETVFQMAQNERIVLVIDEYPYVAKASQSLPSTLQMLIDRYKDSSELFLILCGSSVSYMEDEVLAYQSPLYGRRTGQIKLLPLSQNETALHLQHYSIEDQMTAFGIVGGTPQYLMAVDDTRSIEENIQRLFFHPNSSIYEEPTNLLKQELREPSVYFSAISAIASGSSKLSEIASKTNMSTGQIHPYIKTLMELGIVRKETPAGEKDSKRTIYSIQDPMFRFWFRFVPENESLIAQGASELAYRAIAPYLSDYMGRVFEEICLEYLWRKRQEKDTSLTFTELGRWWGNDSTRKTQVEIDILGLNRGTPELFGECKWTKEPVPQSVLESLVEKSSVLHPANPTYYLFSKSGFTKGCKELAKRLGNVALVDIEQMKDVKSCDHTISNAV